MSKFQRITENTLHTNYGSQDAFDKEPDLWLATLVANRNAQFSDDFSGYGHAYNFKSHEHDDDNELLAELDDRLSTVENILRSFILRLESPKLSYFKHGHEVHEFLCLALGNHRDACLDLTRTLTNFKTCFDNYFIHGSDENSPDILVESQAGKLIERLSIQVPMIYETIENETL